LRLPPVGIKILVAVSGGLDSIALLHLLKARAATRRWKLFVAHFNHRLRGRDSDKDEALVRKTATLMNLPFFRAQADVRRFAARENLSIEMAARRLRHDFFARTARAHGINIVAVAHHADDQVELFFLRLLRGAGGSGLGGMQWLSPSPADERISLVRPLLKVSRPDLENYAREKRIPYRNDATNLSSEFLRNRIRHELLPLLRRNYQAGLNKTILRSMEIAGAESDFVASLAQTWLRQQVFWGAKKARGRSSFVKASFEALPVAIQRQVLKFQIIELGVPPDFELIEMLRVSPEKPVTISTELSVSSDAAGRVLPHRLSRAKFDENRVAVKLDTMDCLVFEGMAVKWGFARAQKYLRKAEKAVEGTEFFDADKVGKEVVLRHWRAGDRFHPIGLNRSVKLQDLFTNGKIPRRRRHELIVAEAKNGIFWVERLRMAEDFKLTPETRRVLSWKWRRHDG
ncbi:MAG TPA: tRNA lysidine(34) synthetase TilS, partial [Verrucomicrobiae bacterium]|nr:tRNA lysidine(34) synthetase TilS [Verrucomicrobiae bacterium]